jgi:hypothetical protein
MKLLFTLALATQMLVWHHRQWRAEWKYWDFSDKTPAGYYQAITGPKDGSWLVPKLEYDPKMRLWELLEESGWVPLRDGDVIVMVDGEPRVRGL